MSRLYFILKKQIHLYIILYIAYALGNVKHNSEYLITKSM